jgi:hypothetical protein
VILLALLLQMRSLSAPRPMSQGDATFYPLGSICVPGEPAIAIPGCATLNEKASSDM